MSLSISQILAVSYPAVLAENRKPTNQWAENAFMRELERQGAIVSKSFGPTLEEPLDYKRNPNAGFLTTDLQQTSLAKTEVLTSASFTPAQLGAPMTWSKMDEVQNPSENQKIALVKSLMENGLTTHDDLIEEALFTTSTSGFIGLATLVPTSGQGTVGAIGADVETWWRNPNGVYQADGSDIEAVFTDLWNTASKGSGSSLSPKFMVSGSDPHALFESTQVPLQRYVDTNEMNAGFKVLAFKTARYVFSQYGGTKVYFLNAKSFKLLTSKEYFRDRGETQEIDDANGFSSKIYSAIQTVVNNKSRLAVADQA